MKVLSLFDGISCGMVAFERARITVDRYVGRKIEQTTRRAIRVPDQKSRTISTASYCLSSNCGVCFKIGNEYYKPNQIEFERLQTLPDRYTSVLPLQKAVFAIGNGWTVDVIAHILEGVNNVNN